MYSTRSLLVGTNEGSGASSLTPSPPFSATASMFLKYTCMEAQLIVVATSPNSGLCLADTESERAGACAVLEYDLVDEANSRNSVDSSAQLSPECEWLLSNHGNSEYVPITITMISKIWVTWSESEKRAEERTCQQCHVQGAHLLSRMLRQLATLVESTPGTRPRGQNQWCHAQDLCEIM